jgi:hypothetical protein
MEKSFGSEEIATTKTYGKLLFFQLLKSRELQEFDAKQKAMKVSE